MSNFSDKVKKLHRMNKLKLKAGVPMDDEKFGYIDPAAIKRAQASIDNKEDSYIREVEEVLVKLDSTWEDIKNNKDEKQNKKLITDLSNYANNIKDMAETFGYKLMGSFGESLRDFCEKIDVGNEAHFVIVQAHIDVMWIAFKHNIKDEGGPQAKDLEQMLGQAIAKYST
ncbi:MAG: hypothetical protein H6867_09330 [Rhodospirillales bacterium]|nr:hypothetical protein [Rhodospirillales bacterium]MCB9996001.1 hypothetical protein [Rhodospirillales bacterium]